MNQADVLPSLPSGARILFIRLRSLGDTVLSTPLYSALKAWQPDLRLSVLVEKPYDEILQNHPDVDQVISIATNSGGRLASFLSRVSALKRIRSESFDCCINLHGGSTSAWFTGLSRARYRVGLQSFRFAACYNVHIQQSTPNSVQGKLHTIEYQMDWLRSLGMPRGETPPSKVVPDPELEQQVTDTLARAGVEPGKVYCVVQPTSKFYTKEWTAEGFAEIVDYLQVPLGFQVVLTGGLGEELKLRKVAELCQRRPVVIEKISISELLWVIRKAKMFVGNDSGPTHIAAALNIPTVVLFGSSDSAVWYPWKSPHRIVQNPFECNPCPGYRCLVFDEPKCILSITSHQVKAAIEALLGFPH